MRGQRRVGRSGAYIYSSGPNIMRIRAAPRGLRYKNLRIPHPFVRAKPFTRGTFFEGCVLP